MTRIVAGEQGFVIIVFFVDPSICYRFFRRYRFYCCFCGSGAGLCLLVVVAVQGFGFPSLVEARLDFVCGFVFLLLMVGDCGGARFCLQST